MASGARGTPTAPAPSPSATPRLSRAAPAPARSPTARPGPATTGHPGRPRAPGPDGHGRRCCQRPAGAGGARRTRGARPRPTRERRTGRQRPADGPDRVRASPCHESTYRAVRLLTIRRAGEIDGSAHPRPPGLAVTAPTSRLRARRAVRRQHPRAACAFLVYGIQPGTFTVRMTVVLPREGHPGVLSSDQLPCQDGQLGPWADRAAARCAPRAPVGELGAGAVLQRFRCAPRYARSCRGRLKGT